jgi:hypothetical protein
MAGMVCLQVADQNLGMSQSFNIIEQLLNPFRRSIFPFQLPFSLFNLRSYILN